MSTRSVRSLRLSPQCRAMHLQEVHQSTLRALAIYLNPKVEACNQGHIQKDWSGLAELMNVSPQVIRNFEENQSPTAVLLEHFAKGKDATVGQLWDYLCELERYDIVDDQKIYQMLERNVQKYRERSVNESAQNTAISSSSSCTTDSERKVKDDQYEERHLTVQDGHFHAFMSACPEDNDYVKELTEVLEGKFGLRLYIEGRDLIPGSDIFGVTADIIAERCSKILLLMSPAYLKSSEYEFQTKIAMTLSPGASKKFIIPVIIKPLKIPLTMQHIHPIDNTLPDSSKWFWGKLLSALKNPQEFKPSGNEMRMLNGVKIPIQSPGTKHGIYNHNGREKNGHKKAISQSQAETTNVNQLHLNNTKMNILHPGDSKMKKSFDNYSSVMPTNQISRAPPKLTQNKLKSEKPRLSYNDSQQFSSLLPEIFKPESDDQRPTTEGKFESETQRKNITSFISKNHPSYYDESEIHAKDTTACNYSDLDGPLDLSISPLNSTSCVLNSDAVSITPLLTGDFTVHNEQEKQNDEPTMFKKLSGENGCKRKVHHRLRTQYSGVLSSSDIHAEVLSSNK